MTTVHRLGQMHDRQRKQCLALTTPDNFTIFEGHPAAYRPSPLTSALEPRRSSLISNRTQSTLTD